MTKKKQAMLVALGALLGAVGAQAPAAFATVTYVEQVPSFTPGPALVECLEGARREAAPDALRYYSLICGIRPDNGEDICQLKVIREGKTLPAGAQELRGVGE